MTVERADAGRAVKHGAKTACHKRTSKNRKNAACILWTTLKGSFTRAGAKGKNRFKFSGRLSSAKLTPDRYRLVATPTRAGGKPDDAVRATFTILR